MMKDNRQTEKPKKKCTHKQSGRAVFQKQYRDPSCPVCNVPGADTGNGFVL